MAQRELCCAVVAGDVLDDGPLVWLTGFTPKLGAAFALVPIHGEPRLLFSGGSGMRASAQRLTWVTDVAALGSLTVDLVAFTKEKTRRLGLFAGQSLPHRYWLSLRAATDELVLLDEALEPARRARGSADLSAAQNAARALDRVEAEMQRALAAGSDQGGALLSCERIAREAGVQDFRARVSSRAFGPPEPADGRQPLPREGAKLAFALRFEQLWLTGTTTIGHAPTHASSSLAEGWRSIRQVAAPTARASDLFAACSSCQLQVDPIGYSMCEPATPLNAPIGDGALLSMTLVAGGEASVAGCALLAIDRRGQRVLWESSTLSGREIAA
jgi:hypothetical protein